MIELIETEKIDRFGADSSNRFYESLKRHGEELILDTFGKDFQHIGDPTSIIGGSILLAIREQNLEALEMAIKWFKQGMDLGFMHSEPFVTKNIAWVFFNTIKATQDKNPEVATAALDGQLHIFDIAQQAMKSDGFDAALFDPIKASLSYVAVRSVVTTIQKYPKIWQKFVETLAVYAELDTIYTRMLANMAITSRDDYAINICVGLRTSSKHSTVKKIMRDKLRVVDTWESEKEKGLGEARELLIEWINIIKNNKDLLYERLKGEDLLFDIAKTMKQTSKWLK